MSLTTTDRPVEAEAPNASSPPPALDPIRATMSCSRGLVDWLVRHRVGMVTSTYQAGQLVFIGARANGQVDVTSAGLSRAMGIAASPQRIYVGAAESIWRFENMLTGNELVNERYDRLYLPRNAQMTGELDIHELAVEPSGRILFANTAYSCVATVDPVHAFKPLWKPAFISKLAPEDRCHLNGLAMEEGCLRYVTACSTTDVVDGWRDHRRDGGVLIDVESNAIVADGLSMPHSPRLRGNFIYLIESGRGALIRIDRQSGQREDVAVLNSGFARGLAFSGDFAVVTISLPRPVNAGHALMLDERMREHKAVPWRGIQIVDLRSGDIVEWFRFDGAIRELFDVALIPGIRCPRGLGPEAPELAEAVRWAL